MTDWRDLAYGRWRLTMGSPEEIADFLEAMGWRIPAGEVAEAIGRRASAELQGSMNKLGAATTKPPGVGGSSPRTHVAPGSHKL